MTLRLSIDRPAVALCLVTMALAACSSEPMPSASAAHPNAPVASVESAPAPVASASSSAAPVASASATPDPQRSPVIPPERLPDVDPAIAKKLGNEGRQSLEVAASICPAAVKHDHASLSVGCRACPPFDSEFGPDGKVVVDPKQDEGFYQLEKVYPGSFSASGTNEAAAVFTGCESHAGNYGGTMLVVKRGNVWVAESYRAGFHPDRCIPFTRPDSRMILVCHWETEHQGFETQFVDTYDFTAGNDEDPQKGWDRVISMGTNVFGSCVMGAVTDPVSVSRVVDFKLDTSNADRKTRLVVTADMGSGPRSKTFENRCATLKKEIEKPNPREIDLASAVATQRKTFTFVWDDKTFAPDAPTKAAMKDLDADAE